MTEPEKCPTCLATVKQPQAYLTTAMRKCTDLWHKAPAPAPEPERCLCGDGPGISMKCPIHWPEAPAPAQGAEPLPDTFALEFMRKNNGGNRRMSNGLWYMCMQQFAEAYAASLREQLAQGKKS